MASTDISWEKWGKSDPYFGVLSDSRFSRESISRHLEEFFATGEDFVAHALDRYEQNFGPLRRERALDFGCGVGRLTLAFARRFDQALGLDVSPSMLSEARTNAARFNIENAVFLQSDDMLGGAEGQFDFVNSYIVLQHIPTKRGMAIINELIDRVRPGGGFLLHFSTRPDGMLKRLQYQIGKVPFANIVRNLRLKRKFGSPIMQMNPYSMTAVLAELGKRGIQNVFLFTEMHGKILTVGLIGQKPEEA